MSDLKFKLQVPPRIPSYNGTNPSVEIEGHNVLLSYDEERHIRFVTVFTYRVGDPNDHGFYGGGQSGIINDSIYSFSAFPNLEFGEFYEVTGFDWKTGLVGKDTKVLFPGFGKRKDMRHFVFFMRDGTFECVCKYWEPIPERENAELPRRSHHS